MRRLTTSQSRNSLREPQGVVIPPRSVYVNERHPLLKCGPAFTAQMTTPREETILLNVQDPDVLLVNNEETKYVAMVGRLCAMCSQEEMVEKQLTSTTSDLERIAGPPDDPEGRYVNPWLAVKSFQRSDASKVFAPEDTRPVVWCRRTVHNIINLVIIGAFACPCESSAQYNNDSFSLQQMNADVEPGPWLYKRTGTNFRFLDVYNFVRDRFRGTWQDLTVQHAPTHRVRS